MIPATHPVVRAMAEEAAREAHSAWEGAIRAMGGTKFLIEETLATRAMLGVDAETDAHAALLTDFDRRATRDAWVRWGVAHQTAAYDAMENERWRLACADKGSDLTDVLGDARVRWRAADHHAIRRNWSALRDNPAALEAAVCAALETTP